MAMIRKPPHWDNEVFLGMLFSMLCDSASYAWDADAMEWQDPKKRWRVRPSYSNLEWTRSVGISKVSRKPAPFDGVWISTGANLAFKDIAILENRIGHCIELMSNEENADQLSLLSNEVEEVPIQ